MVRVFPNRAIEIEYDCESPFKVIGQRVNHYIGNSMEMKVVDNMDLGKFCVRKLCHTLILIHELYGRKPIFNNYIKST